MDGGKGCPDPDPQFLPLYNSESGVWPSADIVAGDAYNKNSCSKNNEPLLLYLPRALLPYPPRSLYIRQHQSKTHRPFSCGLTVTHQLSCSFPNNSAPYTRSPKISLNSLFCSRPSWPHSLGRHSATAGATLVPALLYRSREGEICAAFPKPLYPPIRRNRRRSKSPSGSGRPETIR